MISILFDFKGGDAPNAMRRNQETSYRSTTFTSDEQKMSFLIPRELSLDAATRKV
jgi:hypothetical protein